MLVKRETKPRGETSQGFGDSIAKLTKFFGIEPCGGCERRRQILNRLIPYASKEPTKPSRLTSLKSSSSKTASSTTAPSTVEELSNPIPESTPAKKLERGTLWLPEERRIQIPYNRMRVPDWRTHHDLLVSAYERGQLDEHSFSSAYGILEQSAAVFDSRIQEILASTGGRRDPTSRSGPLDAEGQRRQDRNDSTSPSPTTGGTTPTSFACGVDVTQQMIAAIDLTRREFANWSNRDKNTACQSITSWSTGDVAWDIIEMHSQVTSDTLNKSYRPSCATSGADPPCGSSVTVSNSCHFAGSANYVIFGVMCRLCNSYYDTLLNQRTSNWDLFHDFVSSTSVRDFLRMNRDKFNENGMLYLIDLYKKYVPLLSLDPVARNINAAKAWSQAGFHGWPTGRATPSGDRSNCTLTCGVQTPITFTVSWYPHLNPYATRR